MTQRLAAIGVLVALAITLDGCVSPGHSAVIPATQNKYLGVYEQGTLSTYRAVSKFAAETGRVPNIVLYYSGWYEKFNVQFAERAYAHGAVPFVQIDPTDISLAAIAAPHLCGRVRRCFTSPTDVTRGAESFRLLSTQGAHTFCDRTAQWWLALAPWF